MKWQLLLYFAPIFGSKEKVNDYHAFGVKNVIWIFTKNKKIMVAKSDESWLTHDWNTDVVVIEGLTINLANLIGNK